MMDHTANWSFPTPIRFGPGRIAELPATCAELEIKRPLIVTDPGLAPLPMIGAAEDACRAVGLGAAVFSEVKGNPIDTNVTDGVAALKAGDHDGVIAFGGGSALDVAKAIALMGGQTRPMWDFEMVDDWWTRADADAILPIVAVPTTAGTGSEVGRASVIGNSETHAKKIIFHPRMLPSVVISDPELTVGLPANVTAWTGLDALAHCLEAYSSTAWHPMAEGIAVEGMRLVKDYLPRAVKDGSDIEARGAMLAAASMGATAFQKGLGAIHSLSHPVGALYDTHHGLTNAVFMPYVLTFNRPAIEDKMVRLADWLGIGGGYGGFCDWVLTFRQDMSIPHTLVDLGVDDARFDEMAAMAVVDPTADGNPIPFDQAQATGMLEAARDGAV